MARNLGCLAFACAVVGYVTLATIGYAQSAAEILEKAEGDPARVDITDAILAGTSPDCADYATSYTSEATDLQQQRPWVRTDGFSAAAGLRETVHELAIWAAGVAKFRTESPPKS